jgi:glucans biosynthesis protein C
MSQAIQKTRLDYLDHLKVALMMLVVAHHAGQPYGSSNGFWYFRTEETTQLGSFFAVNAGFFMSLFFLLSAYFMPASYDRKGAGAFLRDKLQRFGLPVLFGFLILVPLLMFTYYIHFRGYPEIGFFTYYVNVYFGLGGKPAGWAGPSWPDLQFAHLWFVQHLLVYSVLYTLLRRWRPRHAYGREPAQTADFPKPSAVIAFVVVVSLLTFLVRIEYPIDRWVGFLGVIQTEFAHVPQYASFFIVGALAARRQWLTRLPASAGRSWLTVGIILAVLQYLQVLPFHSFGGFTPHSLFYSFYETFLCTGLIIGLLYLFQTCLHRSNTILRRLSANTYAGYIIHVPIVVGLQFWVEAWPIGPMGRFLIVTVLGIFLSFACSEWVLRRLPYVRSIL